MRLVPSGVAGPAAHGGVGVTADDWVDPIAVERTLVGRDAVGRSLTRAERLAVAGRIRRDGGGAGQVARALSCNWAAARALLNAVDGGLNA